MTVYEDEIDLRPYIKALIQKWWLMAIFVVAGAALGFAFSRISAANYEATAMILLTKQTSTLNLTNEFPTRTEPTDSRSRTDTILTIAESDTILLKVIEEVSPQWPADQELTTQTLKNAVTFESKGETILLTATASDPQLAQQLANTWASILIETVNQAYSGEQPLELIVDQRLAAQGDYEEAQSTLETFLQTSQIETLTQKLTELQTVFDGLSNQRSQLFRYFANRKNEMIAPQNQAAGLQAQLQAGNSSNAGDVGDALAVLLARASALNLISNVPSAVLTSSSSDQPTGEQQFIRQSESSSPALAIQINDLETIRDTSANYQADLAALIDLAKTEQETAEAAISEISQGILDGDVDALIEKNAEQIRAIQAQLESEKSTSIELMNARDLSWTAYKALLAKEAEIKNAPKASNYVVMVSSAMPPEEASPRGTLKNMIIAAAAAFFVSVILILGQTWWQSADIFSIEPTGKVDSPQS